MVLWLVLSLFFLPRQMSTNPFQERGYIHCALRCRRLKNSQYNSRSSTLIWCYYSVESVLKKRRGVIGRMYLRTYATWKSCSEMLRDPDGYRSCETVPVRLSTLRLRPSLDQCLHWKGEGSFLSDNYRFLGSFEVGTVLKTSIIRSNAITARPNPICAWVICSVRSINMGFNILFKI